MEKEAEITLEAFTEFLDAVEAGIAAARHRIKTEMKVDEAPKEKTWAPAKISWQNADGASGPYERTEDLNSLDYKEMLKELQDHKGKMNCDGFFYWVFRNGTTVGRKEQKKK